RRPGPSYLTRWPDWGGDRRSQQRIHNPEGPARSGFFLGFEDLTALVHPGLEIEMMRAAQFAGILVLGIGRLLQRIRRTAHATPRGRCFSSGNGHIGVLKGVSGHRPRSGRLSA